MDSVLANVFKPQLRSASDLQFKQVETSFFGFPFFGGNSKTLANDKSALTLSAFYNAVDMLSDDIAKLPKHVFRKVGDHRHKYPEHPVNYLLSVRPNPKMTPFDFWKVIEVLRILKGNAIVEIIRSSQTGRAIAWIILENKHVEILETSEKLYYRYKDRIIDSDDILHFKGFSLDGKVGVGVVTYAAAQLGVSLEAQEYGSTIYKNRGVSYGVIESDKSVADPNKKLISDGFTAKLSEKNPHKAPVLDEGLKYKSISITPAEAQFLETNKNGIIEVCRWLNIAPHKLKELGNANYSNIYQQSIEHVQDSVLPRVVAKEQELDFKCFTEKERASCYIRFNMSVLLRADLSAKGDYYTKMILNGSMVRNEVRAFEDMNPLDGLDEPLQPLNMQTIEMATQILKQQANGTQSK